MDSDFDATTVSIVVYNSNGSIRSTHVLPATPDATIAGNNVFTLDGFGINRNGAVALQINGVTTSFLSFNRVVTVNGEDSTQIGTTGSGETLVSTDGESFTVQDTPNPGVIPCFLAGTMIQTADGVRAVDSLSKDDLIQTADGLKQLRWIGERRISRDAALAHTIEPICIPAGALGPGKPARDLYVSPSHRMCLNDGRFALYFEGEKVLVPARHLVGWRGIHIATGNTDITYVHLLFDSHELVYSEGVLSESFHPAVQNALSFSPEAQRELRILFPDLWHNPDRYGATYARCLKSYETRVALDMIGTAIAA